MLELAMLGTLAANVWVDLEEGTLWPSGQVELPALEVQTEDHMLVVGDGRRTRRAWIPEDWPDRPELLPAGAARHGSDLLYVRPRGRRPQLVRLDVDVEGVGTDGRHLVHPDWERVFDVHQRVWVDLPPVRIGPAHRSGGWWVAPHDQRAVAWDAGGRIHLVSSEPDRGVHRFSADHRRLGLVGQDGRGRVHDLEDGSVREWTICAAARELLPIDHTTSLVRCPSGWTLVDPTGAHPLGLGEVTVQRAELERRGVSVLVDGMGGALQALWVDPDNGRVERVRPEASGDQVDGYAAGRPVRVAVTRVDGLPVERATARAWSGLVEEAAGQGHHLRIVSGFRTWAEQERLYACFQSGDCNNGNLAARPGHSRHQSGIAVDVDVRDRDVLAWLRANGPDHGFHETVRGEPWHWEYAGERAATALPVRQLLPAELEEVAPSLPLAVLR